uniref:FPL domain-containing protein n=1 Tax=Peronospora matthiolae TaxID=2874970 RepID=A0AAV1T9H9_9STRA
MGTTASSSASRSSVFVPPRSRSSSNSNSTSTYSAGNYSTTTTSINSTSYRTGFLTALLSSRRLEFTLANMRTLHAQLTRFEVLRDADIVELLRVLAEFLIYSDQHRVSTEGDDDQDAAAAGAASDTSVDDLTGTNDDAGAFFDYFGETNMLALFVELGASAPSIAVQVQLLQTMSILVQNIATRTSLYYILSNNHVNRLLECPFLVDQDDDVRDWYVTLLKALSLRLNHETVQFFLDTQQGGEENMGFPLYARALAFGRCKETMVKVAVKTLTLNVLNVPDMRVRRFVLQYDNLKYFRDIVEIANDLTLMIQGLLNTWPCAAEQTAKTATSEKLEEAVDAYIDHCFYLQDLLAVDVPELCYKIGNLLFARHVRCLLAASILPNCAPPPQRVSTQLALYLLSRLLGILEHTPLVNAIVYMMLSSDAGENYEYSRLVLGARSSQQQDGSHCLEALDTNNDVSNHDVDDGDDSESDDDGEVGDDDDGDDGGDDSEDADGDDRDKEGDTLTTENLPQLLSPQPSIRWDEEAPLMHTFRPHSASSCESSLCYIQTRFSMGEWPDDEVKAFVPQNVNCYRQSFLSLLCSSDERLSTTAVMLLLAIVNNKAADHSLLRELDLLPFRYRHRQRVDCDDNREVADDREAIVPQCEAEEKVGIGTSNPPVTTHVPSSCDCSGPQENVDDDANEAFEINDIGTEAPNEDDDEVSSAAGFGRDPSFSTDEYPHWLIDLILKVLAQNLTSRLLSVQLCTRVLVDMMVDTCTPTLHCLVQHHAAALKSIHSNSARLTAESMRGTMAEVDLFLYVLEKEVEAFQRTAFPMELQLDSSSPFECLIPLETAEATTSLPWAGIRDTLALRCPVNDIEVCRKSVRVFLLLRKLRELLDASYVNDGLEWLVANRHPRTSVLASAAAGRHPCTVALDGMVSIRCMYREQRFLLMPTKLLMVMNPEAFVLMEKIPDQSSDSSSHDGEGEGVVRMFAPVHRTYCKVDPRDDRVLQVLVRSAVSVPGCRSARKDHQDASTSGKLQDWHVLLMFPTSEDCAQARAHITISGTEVRAFKLHQIKRSFTAHLEVTQSSSNNERQRSWFTNVEFDASISESGDKNDGKSIEIETGGEDSEINDDKEEGEGRDEDESEAGRSE